MKLTQGFHLHCICAIFLVHYSQAQIKKVSSSTTTTTTPVPVLDLKQILEIANNSSTSKDLSQTPTSSVNLTTSSISSTTSLPPTLSKSTPSLLSSTPGLSNSSSESSSNGTHSSVYASTERTPTETPDSISESQTTTNAPVVNETEMPSEEVVTEIAVSVSENISQVGPEFLMASPSPTTEASTTTTTTPTTTTTTKAPEPIRLGPIVKITQGELRPAVLRSRGGKRYYAFLGIKYANPPIHFQRFKEPAPVSPWSEVFNATSYGPTCIQYNILSEEVEGEEDCLTLNIFTNWLPSGRNKKRGPGLYPVMVFFHQGAFMFGTSSDFQEKYMMDEPVVLVTVQYRLGAFGFLNTQGDSDARGNQGLKDQVLALKFIKDNIHFFNGEPNLVTIFGESAGGSSVHYHLLSERSRGLFHRAISMSGTALSPWAFTRSPRKMAKKLGTLLNCPTTDMNELFTCLQGHDARIIADKTKELYEWNTDPITPFGPSVEVEESLGSFITESPYSLMKNGRINEATPWMLGVVENVCLLDAWSVLVDKQLTDDMNVDWHRIAPITFMFKETALEPDAVSNQIRAYYFGTKDVGNDTSQNLEQLYSDRYFNHGIRTSALMHVRTNEATPVYLYIFSYKGSESHTKFAGISDIIGVSEGDDLRFLFNTNRFDDIPLNSTDGEVSQNLVKLWVSFAKEGKPTAVWSDQEWKRITPSQVKGDEALLYYSLNKKCGFVEEPFSSRMNFWDTLPLNENENELISSYNIHHRKPDNYEDLFDRYN